MERPRRLSLLDTGHHRAELRRTAPLRVLDRAFPSESPRIAVAVAWGPDISVSESPSMAFLMHETLFPFHNVAVRAFERDACPNWALES